MKRIKFVTLIVVAALVFSACSSPSASVANEVYKLAKAAAADLATQQAQDVQVAAPQGAAQQPATTPVPVPAGANEMLAAYEGVLQNLYQTVNPSVVSIRVVTPVTDMTGFGQFGFPNIPGFPFGDGQGNGQDNGNDNGNDNGQDNGNGNGNQDDQGNQQQPNVPHFGEGAGSGFVWDTAGHIVTNNHVVDGATKIEVIFSDGTTVQAKVVGTDPNSDIAVLSVDAPAALLKPVQMADYSPARVGQLAIAIGNPFGLEGTMTVGIVSAVGRSVPLETMAINGRSFTMPDVIQTDAPINPGNSGGVLVDDQGKVIGITYMIESPSGTNAGIGFAIPAAAVNKVVPALIKDGSFKHSYLGISGGTLTPELASAMNLPDNQRGVLVGEVADGGPSEKAGLKGSANTTTINGQDIPVGGDVITAIDGTAIHTMDELISYLSNQTSVGQAVTLSILRDGKTMEVKVTLGERPTQ